MTEEANRRRPLHFSDDILGHVFPFHCHILDKYGKNSFTWRGPIPRVNIMEPDVINEIMMKYEIFKKPKQHPIHNLLTTGIGSYEGQKWAKQRRIMNPAFYTEKLKDMLPAMHVSCAKMISQWEKQIDASQSGEDCEIEISSFFQNMTSDVISRTAFGSSYEEGMKIFEIQQKQADLVYFALQSPIPWFLSTKTNKKIKQMKIEIDRLVKVIVEKREKSIGKGEDGDLLGLLLENNMKEKAIKKDDAMSIEDVIEECKLFYFTGQITTSNLLVWAIVSLAIHSEWQALARDEIRQAFGDNVPDFDGLNRLKIVTMIIYEVLRLYPPAPMMIRIVEKETQIGHISLPLGCQLMVPIIFIHRDRQLWGNDAEEFKPERFAKGLAAASERQGSFLPFGGGPRICIGNNFAMMEAKMALSLILRRFSFILSPSYVHAPTLVVTLRPQFGAQIVLRKCA